MTGWPLGARPQPALLLCPAPRGRAVSSSRPGQGARTEQSSVSASGRLGKGVILTTTTPLPPGPTPAPPAHPRPHLAPAPHWGLGGGRSCWLRRPRAPSGGHSSLCLLCWRAPALRVSQGPRVGGAVPHHRPHHPGGKGRFWQASQMPRSSGPVGCAGTWRSPGKELLTRVPLLILLGPQSRWFL